MRRAIMILGALIGISVAGFILGVGAGVAAGGVPYPDGPHAGHLSAPGVGRVLENISGPVMLAGVAMLAATLAAAPVVLAVVWFRRGRGS